MLSIVKIRQLEFEIDHWKNSLKFMTEENVRMKARLSELLQQNISQEKLDESEDFQSQFIQHDDLIRLLRNTIAAFESMLKNQSSEGSNIETALADGKSISSRIEAARMKFDLLTDRFNRFALHNF